VETKHLNPQLHSSSKPSTYAILAVTAFLLPPLSMLSPNALVIVLLAQAALFLWILPLRLFRDRLPRPAVAGLAAFVLLGLASVGWSIIPDHSLRKVADILVLFIAGLITVIGASTVQDDRRVDLGLWLARGIVVALVASLAALLSAYAVDASGTFLANVQTLGHYKRGAAMLVLFAGPAAFSLYRRHDWRSAAVLSAAVIGCAFAIDSGLSLAAAALGLAVFALASRFSRAARTGLIICLVGLFAAAPLMRFAPNEVPQDVQQEISHHVLGRINSAAHRMLIWQFAAERTVERPVFGWGLDSSRAMPGGQDHPQGYPERLPLHPHNAIMQIWLELGAVGALIAALTIVWSVSRIGTVFPASQTHAVALGMTVATVVTALTAWSIWLTWWLAGIWLVVALMGAVLPGRARGDHLS
jgi:O-antigen ligase